nr:tyrosine protein kinase Src42A [Hymenolepis microstoma]
MHLRQKIKKVFGKKPLLVTDNINFITVSPVIEEEVRYKSAYALYNYASQNDDEISFLAGDVFTVYNDDDDWWKVKNCRTGQEGLIPFNYVTTDKREAIVLEGWFDVDRSEAEKKLLVPGVEVGMFIIRPGKDIDFPYTLSVRGEGTEIVHYRVEYDRSTGYFFLTPRFTFPTMDTLLNYYKTRTIDEKQGLTEPRPLRVNPPITLNECKYDLGKLKILEELGSGHFGVVFKARIGNVLMAVKKSKGKEGREAFIQEAKRMLLLKHPSIVQFLGIAEDSTDKSIIIMLEFMANGSLNQYLKKRGKSKFEYVDLITMADTLVQGMIHLESLNIVHMDLRAENVLVNGEGKVKISDFGLTQIIGSDMNCKIEKFPARWAAPEIMLNQAKYTTKSDVWSFGVLLFEILTYGMLPYKDLDADEVKKAVLNGRRLPSPAEYGFRCEPEIYSVMQSCWNVDPEKRPRFREIYLKTQTTIIIHTDTYDNAAATDRD